MLARRRAAGWQARMRLHPVPLTPRAAQVLMATNRIDILDPALLRPGRIDRKIEFPNPNESSRLDILKIHSRRMNLMRGINLKKIADKMTGASGAELKVRCLAWRPCLQTAQTRGAWCLCCSTGWGLLTLCPPG